MIYFDWNATTPLRPEAKAAFLEALDHQWANPSASYRAGARVKNSLEAARQTVADLLRCEPEEIIFTSGATESNNAVIREMRRISKDDKFIGISAIEHPAVSEPARSYWGDQVITFAVDKNGRLDEQQFIDQVEACKPALVSIMAANNETGVLQPWKWVLDECQKRGVPFHVDAAQWVGKLPLQKLSDCDFVSFSGHKFGGPKGVGVLKVGAAYRGIRLQLGGGQENDFRGGTENVPAILSMVAALSASCETLPLDSAVVGRDQFQNLLKREWGDELVIYGERADRLWNTACLAMPEFESTRWISRLDRRGFSLSSGAACSTGKSGPSATLAAMGISSKISKRTLRVSGGPETTCEDWIALGNTLIEIRSELSQEGPSSNVIEID